MWACAGMPTLLLGSTSKASELTFVLDEGSFTPTWTSQGIWGERGERRGMEEGRGERGGRERRGEEARQAHSLNMQDLQT